MTDVWTITVLGTLLHGAYSSPLAFILSLHTTEHRLQQLEGSRTQRKPLTSKAMLRSIQQTRENHMRQFISGDGPHGNESIPRDTSSEEDSKVERVEGGMVCDDDVGETEQTLTQCSSVETHPSPLVCPRWRNYEGEERETLIDKDECSLARVTDN